MGPTIVGIEDFAIHLWRIACPRRRDAVTLRAMSRKESEVVHCSFRLSSRVSWPRLLAHLKRLAAVERIDARRERCRFLDTFDHGLRRAERWLLADDAGLSLNRSVAGAISCKWFKKLGFDESASEPLGLSDLGKAGACQSRFAKIYPIADSTDRVERYACQRHDGETVALEYRAMGEPNSRRTAARMVTVLGPEECRSIALALRDALAEQGLQVIESPFDYRLEKSMTEFGLQGWRFAVTQEIAIVPTATLADAIQVVGEKSIQAIRLLRPSILAGMDDDFVHAFRVSARRMRSLVKATRGALAAPAERRLKLDLKQIGSLSNRLRDLDVLLQSRKRLSKLAAGALAEGADLLFAELVEWREAERVKARAFLESRVLARQLDHWKYVFEKPDKLRKCLRDASEEAFRDAVVRYLDGMAKRIRSHAERAFEGDVEEEIHRVRVMCKDLRYVLWFSRFVFNLSLADKIESKSRRLQDALGQYNDECVQMSLLREYIEHCALADKGNAVACAAAGAILQGLEAKRDETRRRARKAFSYVSAGKLEKAIGKLVGSTTE